METKTRTLMLVLVAVLAVAGSAAAAPAPVCNATPAASLGVPEPLNLASLHPECCRTISATPEATCDSVSWSPGRCNQYNGGGQCLWTCQCCRSINPQYTDAYCAQFDALGADRCNQVWQGTACAWTC